MTPTELAIEDIQKEANLFDRWATAEFAELEFKHRQQQKTPLKINSSSTQDPQHMGIPMAERFLALSLALNLVLVGIIVWALLYSNSLS